MLVGIVGAGISGSYLAYLLGGIGHEVVLLDHRAPWEKPCGGGITFRTYHCFPLLQGFRESCLAVKEIRMISADGEECTVDAPEAMLIASRRSLGEYLLAKAGQRDVKRIRKRVHRIVPEADGWAVHAGGSRYHFDFLCGADGARSLVRKTLVGRFPEGDTTLAVGYRVKGDPNERMVIGFVRGITGYVWLFPGKDHISAGICAGQGEATGQELYGRLDDFLQRFYPHLMKSPRTRYAGLIPSLTREGLGGNQVCGKNWALVGDAAGWVDPLTSEGIYYAFRSAEFLSQALSSGRVREYDRSCCEELVPELAQAASYVRTFFDPRVSRRLVSLVREHQGVRNLFIRLIAGEQGYLSLKKELFRILPGLTLHQLSRVFRFDSSRGAPGRTC